MSNYTDQSYLRSYQYQDSSNLSARALLHKLYSTNPENWQRWIFNQLALPERCKILELGSGPGYLWQENQQRILPGWKIVLSDFSTGMLEESQDALGEESGLFFGTLDAQSIPFPENSFEAIIANHMLYHVPSIERAFAEIQRVLIPGGCLYAATNGLGHLAKIRKWKKEFFQEEITTGWGKPAERFGLENGENQLNPWFSSIKLTIFPDQLFVTDPEPIIRYLKSWSDVKFPLEKEARFRSFLAEKLASNEVINITKETGLFECIV